MRPENYVPAGRPVRPVAPMSDRAVPRVVQRRVAAAGDDSVAFAGHPLRSGFLTSAVRAGASIFEMRAVSRHRSLQVLADDGRDARVFDHGGENYP